MVVNIFTLIYWLLPKKKVANTYITKCANLSAAESLHDMLTCTLIDDKMTPKMYGILFIHLSDAYSHRFSFPHDVRLSPLPYATRTVFFLYRWHDFTQKC